MAGRKLPAAGALTGRAVTGRAENPAVVAGRIQTERGDDLIEAGRARVGAVARDLIRHILNIVGSRELAAVVRVVGDLAIPIVGRLGFQIGIRDGDCADGAVGRNRDVFIDLKLAAAGDESGGAIFEGGQSERTRPRQLEVDLGRNLVDRAQAERRLARLLGVHGHVGPVEQFCRSQTRGGGSHCLSRKADSGGGQSRAQAGASGGEQRTRGLVEPHAEGIGRIFVERAVFIFHVIPLRITIGTAAFAADGFLSQTADEIEAVLEEPAAQLAVKCIARLSEIDLLADKTIVVVDRRRPVGRDFEDRPRLIEREELVGRAPLLRREIVAGAGAQIGVIKNVGDREGGARDEGLVIIRPEAEFFRLLLISPPTDLYAQGI